MAYIILRLTFGKLYFRLIFSRAFSGFSWLIVGLGIFVFVCLADYGILQDWGTVKWLLIN
jgi:hypothetical protein